MKKLTDQIHIDVDLPRRQAVNILHNAFVDTVEGVFKDSVIANGTAAYFVYGQGPARECRPIYAASARGVDLHDALRLFAESVEDGARSRLDDADETLSFEFSVENDDWAPGVRVVVSEFAVDAPYAWTLAELPRAEHDGWEKLGRPERRK